MNVLGLINRDRALFQKDLVRYNEQLLRIIPDSSFLILGGAGSIGAAVTKEIYHRAPKQLHVVDISENNLAELVRDIRSSTSDSLSEFRTFCLDIGSLEYDMFYENQERYDYILNFSALKHVRSEKDPYTLMRMIDVNILNTIKTLDGAKRKGVKRYFCVSTDKAANPVNMMGASKRIMEFFLKRHSSDISISTARFANVAFSDGSLLYSFIKRMEKKQPIVAPAGIRRYFVTAEEAGQLCLLSCLIGDNTDIFFPKLDAEEHLIDLADVAKRFIRDRGFSARICEENEARRDVLKLISEGEYPLVISTNDTTGEKLFEEFFVESELVDLEKYSDIGVVKNSHHCDNRTLDYFIDQVKLYKDSRRWSKNDIVELFHQLIPDFKHVEKGKSLDEKM